VALSVLRRPIHHCPGGVNGLALHQHFANQRGGLIVLGKDNHNGSALAQGVFIDEDFVREGR
jgi:hypothetical protein